jgi:2,4-dienoyl-CoA reductase-like NADH-dependent reductase (Old Yellow Enzyme family)
VTDSPRSVAPLFSPFDVKSLRLRNRFAMAPMTRMRSPGGVPNSENVEYYRRRAAGGTGLIVTEGTYVRGPAGPSPAVPRFYGDESAEGWHKVADAVHAEGAAIIPQLWHLGAARGADPEFLADRPTLSPSGVDLDGAPLGQAMTDDDLAEAVAAYAESARLAQDLGFDGVELHGAHGYLLDQFFWERTNQRDDGYGGSIEARSVFPAQVVAAVRAAVGPEFAIVYRFSQWKGGHYDARMATAPDELRRILTPLVDAGVDVFHASTRRHWEPEFDEHGRGLAGWTREVTGRPTITVGSVGVSTVFQSEHEVIDSTSQRLDRLVEQFERGEFDIVALGRALLADADWVDKLRTDRLADVVPYVPRSA